MASISQLLVILLFLFWSSTDIVLSRKTTKYPVKSSVDEAQEKFLNAQSTIIRIRAGELIGEGLDEMRTRLTTLQSEMEQLIESTNTRSAESIACEMAMKSMTNSYQSFDDRLRNLQMEFEAHSELENRTSLFREIVEDIRSNRFKLADEKFVQLNDVVAIPKIVHEVYAHSEENFGLILNFAVEVSDSAHCFIVLKTLYEEMAANNHSKPQKLIILAHAYDNEVRVFNSSDTKFRAQLVDQIKTTSADVLIKAMKFGDFSTNEEIRNLLVQLYDFSPRVSNDVMQLLVDESYGVVESRAILVHVFVQCNTPQAVSGISNLFWKIKDVGHLNDSVLMLDIASNLSELRQRKDFADLSDDLRESVDKVVSNIPKCARNLFFEPSVCLWNKARNVYAHAANETFNFDKQRRRIFATPSAGIPPGAAWIAEKKGDDILFRSKDFAKEYLYFAEIEYNTEMRYLFSWVVGDNKDKQSAFKIELLDDDLCYLKSSKFNEYMFASDVMYKKDESNSYVFSWKKGTVGDLDSEFAWQIRSC